MKTKEQENCEKIQSEKTVNLGDFFENPNNPSKATPEQLERLAEKLKRIPIGLTAIRIAYVTDAPGGGKMVLSGNKRLRVLKMAYGENAQIPAEWVVDITAMTPEQRHEFIVDANVTDGEWDLDKLLEQYDRQELADLMGSDAVDGLLSDLDNGEDTVEGKTDEDSVPSTQQQPKSKRGNVYALGEHRLMCGDSTLQSDMAVLMGGEMADLMVTDPPYNVDYTGRTKDALKIENDHMSDDNFLAFLIDAFRTSDSVLRRGGAFYIWHASSESYNFNAACRDVGWKVRQVLVWVKNSIVLGRQDYQWQHELCLYGWKDGSAHYFIDSRDLSTVTEDCADIQNMKLKELRQFTQELLARGMGTSTVIHEQKPARSAEHPTMKPVRLFLANIRNSTRVGEIVIDPFGGSGTTVIACEQLHRRARLMELDPHYADVIRKRWAEFVHGEGCDWENLTPAIAE